VPTRGFPGFSQGLAIVLVNKQEEHKHAGRHCLVAMRAQRRTVACNPVLQSGCRREPRYEQGSVAFDAGGFECFWTPQPTVDGRAGFLQRLGRQGELGNLPKLALVRETFLRPGALNNLQRLFISRPHLLWGDPKPRKVLRIRALADPEVEPSAT